MKVAPEILFKRKYYAFQHVAASPILRDLNINQADIELLLITNAIADKYGTFDIRELKDYSGMSTSSIRNWREKMRTTGFIQSASGSKSFLYRLNHKSKLILKSYTNYLVTAV